MNNIRPGYDECTNTWDDGYPIGGNYWSEYTGPDTDGDGIGDLPYNISGGSNQDLYPLMHPFEIYYLLNLTLDHPEVYEGGIFNVTVKTIGGTVAPKAHVTFNDHLILTNTTGVAQFTAPFVTEDTIFLIQAIKPGYISDNTSIIIKNTQQESGRAIIFGRITNVTTAEESIIFQAVNTRVLTFSPLSFHHYRSGEMLQITKEYKGLLLAKFVFILCEIL